RSRRRQPLDRRTALFINVHQATCGSTHLTLGEVGKGVASAMIDEPDSAALHHLMACLSMDPQAAAASGHRAVTCDADWFLAYPGLVVALASNGDREGAIQIARTGLARLERRTDGDGAWCEGFVRANYQREHVAWDRCGWCHAGDPPAEERAKRQWVRGQLHALL